MKKLALLMLACGFLGGAYATSLDVKEVHWPGFGIAAALAIAGLILAKRSDRAMATSGGLLETNRSELNGSLGNIVSGLGQVIDNPAIRGEALINWIDAELRPDLRRFADARDSMVHLYGLQTYADIMSEFAAGERYINRVWSTTADGYDEEAEIYLRRANHQFGDALAQLAAAAA